MINSQNINNLHIFQLSNIEYENTLLYIFSISSILFGVYTIISKNPIVSVLFLIGLFSSVALYLITAGLYFLGLSYILVYIGAISILFIFILMLINIRISELLTNNNNSLLLGFLTIVLVNITLYKVIPFSLDVNYYLDNNMYNMFSKLLIGYQPLNTGFMQDISNVESKSWDSSLVFVSQITTIGNMLYTIYFIPFMILSLILLLAMVGAIIITISKSKNMDTE